MGILDLCVKHMLQDQGALEFDPDSNLLVPTPGGPLAEFAGRAGAVLGEGDDGILGTYTPMASPGRITLVADRQRQFFWSLVSLLARQGTPILRDELLPMAQLVALGTYHHEYFHFFCDVQRRLFPGSRHERDTEEALATAYGRLKVDEQRRVWQSKVGRLPGFVFHRLVTERFRYTAPGYRDWPAYATWDALYDGLVRYLDPPNAAFLRASGVDLDGMLGAQLERVYQCRVIETLA